MSTRGLLGFKWDKNFYAAYNHMSSYPSWLGKRVVDMVSGLSEEEIQTMKENLQKLKWIPYTCEEYFPNEDQKKELEAVGYFEEFQDTRDETWYWMLRNIQGESYIDWVLRGIPYLIDFTDFFENSEDCEYAYILDFNKKVLEFWKGRKKIYCTDIKLKLNEILDLNDRAYRCDIAGTYYFGPCEMVGKKPFNNLDGWKNFFPNEKW